VQPEGDPQVGASNHAPSDVSTVTDSYRQEYYEGQAEDMFWVVATGETRSVPLGRFDDTLRVIEWTPLEPGIVVEKTYAPAVGLLSERALSGGRENVRLLEVQGP
jgi:hypothetical protein